MVNSATGADFRGRERIARRGGGFRRKRKRERMEKLGAGGGRKKNLKEEKKEKREELFKDYKRGAGRNRSGMIFSHLRILWICLVLFYFQSYLTSS